MSSQEPSSIVPSVPRGGRPTQASIPRSVVGKGSASSTGTDTNPAQPRAEAKGNWCETRGALRQPGSFYQRLTRLKSRSAGADLTDDGEVPPELDLEPVAVAPKPALEKRERPQKAVVPEAEAASSSVLVPEVAPAPIAAAAPVAPVPQSEETARVTPPREEEPSASSLQTRDAGVVGLGGSGLLVWARKSKASAFSPF